MPRSQTPPARYLLVEGKDDQHVAWHLCSLHRLPETFTVEVPEGDGGITELLDGLTARIRAPYLQTLGIVVDADIDLAARWQAIRDRLQDRVKLQARTYSALPAAPPSQGWISPDPGLPRVGVWLMPDNQTSGILEDFATRLIPAGDALFPKADAVLQDIERESLQRYGTAQRPKALIHTWLAWQEIPGQPIGTALTAQSLMHDAPLARAFVGWLRLLFHL